MGATAYGIAEARQIGQQQRCRIAFGVGRDARHYFAGEAVECGVVEHRPRLGRIGWCAAISTVAAAGLAGVVAFAFWLDLRGFIFGLVSGIVGHAALPRTISLKSFTPMGVSSCTVQPALAAVWPQRCAAVRPASSLSTRTISRFMPGIGGKVAKRAVPAVAQAGRNGRPSCV